MSHRSRSHTVTRVVSLYKVTRTKVTRTTEERNQRKSGKELDDRVHRFCRAFGASGARFTVVGSLA